MHENLDNMQKGFEFYELFSKSIEKLLLETKKVTLSMNLEAIFDDPCRQNNKISLRPNHGTGRRISLDL